MFKKIAPYLALLLLVLASLACGLGNPQKIGGTTDGLSGQSPTAEAVEAPTESQTGTMPAMVIGTQPKTLAEFRSCNKTLVDWQALKNTSTLTDMATPCRVAAWQGIEVDGVVYDPTTEEGFNALSAMP